MVAPFIPTNEAHSYDVTGNDQEAMRWVDSDGSGTGQILRLTNRYLWADSVDQLLSDEQYWNNTGMAINATTSSTVAGNTLWTLGDHLGSIRDLLDNNGVIREHQVFDSYGRLVREVDYNSAGQVIASNDASAVDTVFGYTGRSWDTDVNLQYNRARWYDPQTGRWLSQDPIGFAAGDANLYRYVGNKATYRRDPSGLIDPLGPTRTRPWEFHDSWTEKQKVTWLQSQWRRYSRSIEKAANKHGVPEDLLTVVVFNEMMDYSLWEWMGERMGYGSSCGPGQLTETVLRSHGIYPESMKIDGEPRVFRRDLFPLQFQNEGEVAIAVEKWRKWNAKYRAAMIDPDTNIDLLAQLVKVYIGILKSKTNTADGSWGLSDRVVTKVIGMPLSKDHADRFRLELSRCGRAKTRVSQSMMTVIQAMTNDTETVLTDEGINDNVLQHVWNAGGLFPYIHNNQHKER
jgi:RHS repeat-associated protein